MRFFKKLEYVHTQSTRAVWYAAQYSLGRKLVGPIESENKSEPNGQYESPTKLIIWQDYLEAFFKDFDHANQGLYQWPEKLSLSKTLKAVRNSARYFSDLDKVNERRKRKGSQDVRDEVSDAERYPAYYLQNFHFQSDGWLSAESAKRYETQVEILFSGAAGPMRRLALAQFGKEVNKRNNLELRYLELGVGTGDFTRQLLESYPLTKATLVDLSRPYLAVAQNKLHTYNSTNFICAPAEQLPLSDAVIDVVNAIYLFHEVPPKIRKAIFQEVYRVLSPGGLFIFCDSIQWEDSRLDQLLAFFPNYFHEPYYKSYLDTDFHKLGEDSGFVVEDVDQAFLTKVITFRKVDGHLI